MNATRYSRTCPRVQSLTKIRKLHVCEDTRLFLQFSWMLLIIFLWNNQTGQSPLMLAVSRGRMEMVELTLEAGADINATDEVKNFIFILERLVQISQASILSHDFSQYVLFYRIANKVLVDHFVFSWTTFLSSFHITRMALQLLCVRVNTVISISPSDCSWSLIVMHH